MDICAYPSPAMMDCMFIERLQTAQSDPDYAALFHGRPRRFVLPLKPRPGMENKVSLVAGYSDSSGVESRVDGCNREKYSSRGTGWNSCSRVE